MSTALDIGASYGGWTIVSLRAGGLYRTKCDGCGTTVVRGAGNVLAGPVCRRCVSWRGRRSEAELERAREEAGVPAIDFEIRTDDDPVTLALIEDRGPMRLEDIGAAMGVTRQRVEQIEKRARMQVAAGLAAAGCSEEDVREWLMRRPVEHALEGGSPESPGLFTSDERPRIRNAVDREGYETPSRSWERGLDRVGRPERIAAVGFESELGLALERAVALLEVEAEMAALAASIATDCAEAAE
jgi:hypothetical protein